MSTEVGNIFFERGGTPAGSPPTVPFDRVCEVFSIGGVGETNDLVDATTFCSGGSREYIAGLSDGQEVSIEANYDQDSQDIATLIADVKAKVKRPYRLVVGDASPEEGFEFDAIPLSWVLNPSVDSRNTITFSFKISGPVEAI